MRRFLAILLLVLPVAAAQAQSVNFPSVAVANVAAGPSIGGWIYRPEGAGPFPAIVLAHSCAGTNAHTDFWGGLLSKWGYLVLAPDSFNPRGRTQVCTAPGMITPNTRVADIAGALDFLKMRPDVIQGRIGLIGHSHGGSTTLRSSQKQFDLASRGLRASVAYYPGCYAAFDFKVDVPLLILIGDKDDWTPAENCRRLQTTGFARPELVEAVYYPRAYHSFDSKAPDRNVPGGPGQMHHLAYDSAAAPDAEARTKAFFEKYLITPQ